MRISKKAMTQVDIMRKEVEAISISNLNKRLDVSGNKNELKDLAKIFDSMLANTEKSMEVQNQFVSDASHELRTPIAAIFYKFRERISFKGFLCNINEKISIFG